MRIKRTLVVIIVTLLFSQWLYLEKGPHNPAARAARAIVDVGNGALQLAGRLLH